MRDPIDQYPIFQERVAREHREHRARMAVLDAEHERVNAAYQRAFRDIFPPLEQQRRSLPTVFRKESK